MGFPYNILYQLGVESPTEDQIKGFYYLFSNLEEEIKNFLLLRFNKCLTIREMALHLGVSYQAVGDRINRNIIKIKKSQNFNYIKYGYEKYKNLKIEALKKQQEEKRKEIINKYKGKESTITFMRELGYPYNLFYNLKILEPTQNQKEILDSFLFKLSKEDRDILLLRFKYFCNYKEISRRVNLKDTDVKIKMSKNLYLLKLSLSYIDYNKFIKTNINNDFYNSGLDILNLSFRSYNCLRRIGINTVGDLIKTVYEAPSTWFINIRNLGRKSAEEVILKLYYIGLFDDEILREQLNDSVYDIVLCKYGE